MKKITTIACALLICMSGYCAKTAGGKQIKSVIEYKVEGSKKTKDKETKYDAKGNKTEVIDYKAGKVKETVKYTYNAEGKCIEEKHYDEANKLGKTVKIEYNEFGKKKSEKNFEGGKLKSEHVFEYITE